MRTLLASLLDPRGRCNRRGLLLAALAMLAVEIIAVIGMWLAGRGVDDPVLLPLKFAVCYLAYSASSQRLHDIGLSAMRIVWAVSGVIVWSIALSVGMMLNVPPERMQPGEAGFLVVFLGTGLPFLAMLLWLHLKRGNAGPNVYGPEPDGLGFARAPARRPRAAPAPAAAAAA